MNAQTDLLSKYASKGAVAITTLFMLWSHSQPDQNMCYAKTGKTF